MIHLIMSTQYILWSLGDFESIEAAKAELFYRFSITEDDLTFLNNSDRSASYSFVVDGKLYYADFEKAHVNIVKWILERI